MLRLSAIAALLYAVVLTATETLLNWGQWQFWPLWLVDYVTAAILLWGGVAALRDDPRAPAILACGWGFALGMMWMSLAVNLQIGPDPERASRVAGFYLGLIGTSLAYSLVGPLLTLGAAGQRKL